jgi:ATP-dependent exoDNAse (exonuclease V) beta subunit
MPLVPKDKDFPKGAAKLLLEVFSDWGLPVDQPGLIYETGVLKPPVGTGEAESVPDADWRLTDRAESSSDLVLRAAFENRQTRIGNLVHDTLYYYSGPKSDLAHAFTRAEQSGNYHTEEVEIAQKHLERIVAIPLFRKWMAEAQQSWNEQDLWFKGKLYRPDKILRLPDRFIIVDYKTGEQQPEYHKQVSQYKEAVEAIFPGTAVEGYVLYTEDGTLEAVPA